jgi:hypothetical protein
MFDRLDVETDKQYLAFCCYAGLAPGIRSMVGAQRLFDQKTGKRAGNDRQKQKCDGSIVKWSVNFNWVERAAAADKAKSKIVHDAQTAAGRSAYFERVEKLRGLIEDTAIDLLKDSKLWAEIVAVTTKKIHQRVVVDGGELTDYDLSVGISLGKRSRDTVAILEIAKIQASDALGLGELIDSFESEL